MKTRLAFQLDEDEEDYRAAASHIGAVEVVGPDEHPDALVASAGPVAGLPTLLVGAIPSAGSGNEFAALPWRFCPQVRAIRASLDAGQLGRPGLLRLHRWSPPGGEPGTVAAVDLALWLIGEQPDATHRTRSVKNDVIHLGFPSGAMALLDFTDTLPAGDGYHSLCLVGSNGAAYADDHRDRNPAIAIHQRTQDLAVEMLGGRVADRRLGIHLADRPARLLPGPRNIRDQKVDAGQVEP